MATVQRFEELEIWKEARLLCIRIFEITSAKNFPKDYGFIKQINDAAGSIMDNIAEGFERGGRKEFLNFLGFAKGSSGDVRSQVYRAIDRKYINHEVYYELLNILLNISKKTGSLINYLNTNELKGFRFKNRQP
jgi:four helix bundle protein